MCLQVLTPHEEMAKGSHGSSPVVSLVSHGARRCRPVACRRYGSILPARMGPGGLALCMA